MVDQNLEQESSDAMHSVENTLASLWDKAREASLLRKMVAVAQCGTVADRGFLVIQG